MPLTDTSIRNVKAGKKAMKLFDERGLYMEVSPAVESGGGSNTGLAAKRSGFHLASIPTWL